MTAMSGMSTRPQVMSAGRSRHRTRPIGGGLS